MTLEDVLQELIQRLGIKNDNTLAWEQVCKWPEGAIEVFQKAGWIKSIEASVMVEYPGCEENCFRPVHVASAQNGQPTRAYVACDQRDDMGKVKIPLARLQQRQITESQIARWISGALGLRGKPERDKTSGVFTLGSIQGKVRLGALELDMSDPVCLKVSGHSRPLREVIFIENGQPVIDQAAILAMIDLPPIPATKPISIAKKRDQQAKSIDQTAGAEIGSPEWRRQTARNAANARHNRPGGSHDKQQQIQQIWRLENTPPATSVLNKNARHSEFLFHCSQGSEKHPQPIITWPLLSTG